MAVSIAHLGPAGTNAEAAALLYTHWLEQTTGESALLCPYPSIAQSLRAASQGQTNLAVVPVENSVEGSVTATMDALWQLDKLQIQRALTLPISHALMSWASTIDTLKTIYSHPQALGQCQTWLERFLPAAQLIPTNSTTEALQHLADNPTVGAIASERAARLYNLPILACPINDHPDNCTRFWVLSLQPSPGGNHTSLAFSVRDMPGALVKPLQVFADRGINMSRIESRPTKRLLGSASKQELGDYLFFIDLQADTQQPSIQSALDELAHCTEILKVFGSYDVLPIKHQAIADV
ncbi:prephenate dehydratase [Leptolyngbya sp. FACHB-36]|uniref:prephenate dehydratase n=1 Tax=Leptolyngbya sp. FACHB-36 TaxID=2692808 RepID=UPI001680753E|nr:prephenate dehydratase [Leptolyngbya sp. FACHB-36]MBD2020617.1 prephenate dehydratase [Leptolyngbya sp. FACHB-36]